MEPENPQSSAPRSFRVRPLPHPGGPPFDRRKRRSSSAAVAIELALTSAAARARLDAMIVVDDDGMLVARSRGPLDLSMLAAVTPIVGRGQAIPRIKREGRQLDMSVETIEIAGDRYYVAALGGRYLERRRELEDGVAAARRILA
jgi:hypothetical protein